MTKNGAPRVSAGPAGPTASVAGARDQDSLDSMVFHDGQMHSITRGHLSMSHDNFLCALCCGQINSQHLVSNTEQSVERRLDGFVAEQVIEVQSTILASL